VPCAPVSYWPGIEPWIKAELERPGENPGKTPAPPSPPLFSACCGKKYEPLNKYPLQSERAKKTRCGKRSEIIKKRKKKIPIVKWKNVAKEVQIKMHNSNLMQTMRE